MALWLVRAGGRGEREEFALENNVAVIGWGGLGDLSDARSRDDILERLQSQNSGVGAGRLTNWSAQVWAFVGRIEVGDLVVLPLKGRGMVAFGRVTGSYRFRPENPADARHTRDVEWVKEVPRSQIDQDLLYSFGAFMTVCRIKRNEAESRVLALIQGAKARRAPAIASGESEPDEVHAPTDIERYARDQIRDHLATKFKGHALADLVAAVLEVQGYKVKVSPEGPDGGVDIIAGHGPMGFDSPRLCVQVKSSDSPVDVKVLRELQGVMQNFGADHGLLVSWGGYKSSVEREARRLFFEIRLWDADDLVLAVQAAYERLPDALQAELPLKRVWTLVLEDDS